MKRRDCWAALGLGALAGRSGAGPLDWFNGIPLGQQVELPAVPYLAQRPDPKARLSLWYFWGTWCGPCRETIPMLNDWVRRYPELQIVAVTDEGADKVAPFVAKLPMAMPVALDTQRQLFGPLRVRAVPYSMMLDAGQRVVWRGQPKQLLDGALERLLAPSQPKA